MKYLKLGKDKIYEPCIEFDDKSIVPVGELIIKFLGVSIDKNIVTEKEVKEKSVEAVGK